MRCTFIAAFLLFISPFPAQATDTKNFDIAGIKLGMKPDGAIDILRKRCASGKNDGARDIKGIYEDPTWRLKVLEDPNPFLKGTKYPTQASCQTDVDRITVQFTSVPSGAVFASRITFEPMSDAVSRKDIYNTAIRKYGTPDSVCHSETWFEWCSDPDPAQEKLPGGCKCANSQFPFLRLEGKDLILFDSRYQKSIRAFQEKSVGRPSF